MFSILYLFLFLKSFNCFVCNYKTSCYGTNLCTKIKQNSIKPNNLSKVTCFKDDLSFIMGTNTPIFKSDGFNL